MEGPPLLPGYTLGRRLGSADSNQWFAVEDATGRAVTLRLIPSPPPAVRERLHAGISLMSAIEHLHIVPLEEAVDVAEGVVVRCGAADGGSLGDAFGTRGSLSPGEMVTACAPVADALAELHPHGIMHGYITIDDIVFTLDGRPMLSGVGMAQLGVPPPPNLTPIAPEIAAGSAPSPSSDVYSLAAVAIIGMTGHLPQMPLQLPSVPPQALAVLSRALERAPERRPDATMLSNALFAIASPEPVEIIASTDATGGIPVIQPAPAAPAPEAQEASNFYDTDASDEADDERVATFMRGEPVGPEDTASGKRRTRRAGGSRRSRDRPAAGEPVEAGTAVDGDTAARADQSWHGEQSDRPAPTSRPAPGAPTAPGSGPAAPGGGRAAPSGQPASGAQPPRRDQPRRAAAQSAGPASAPLTDEDTKTTRPVDTSPDVPDEAEPSAGPRSRRDESRRRGGSGKRRDRGADDDAPRKEPAAANASRSSRLEPSEDPAPSRAGRARAKPSGDDDADDAKPRPAKAERTSKSQGFDVTKLLIGLVVVLVGVGVYFLVDEFQSTSELQGIDDASAETTPAVDDDLCGGPRPAPTDEPVEVEDWTAEMQRLYTLRAQAFTELNPDLLCQVYAPTSPSLAEDVDQLRDWAEAGVHAEGLVMQVIDVEVVDVTGGSVTLNVTDQVMPYELVDEDGESAQDVEGKPEQEWVATLVAVADEEGATPQWRISGGE